MSEPFGTDAPYLPHGERRRQRRVQDAVGLRFKRLYQLPAAGESVPPEPRANKFPQHHKYDIPGYADVKRHQPQVASYIDGLEERIRQLLLDNNDPTEQPTHKVNISVSGMAFADDTLLHTGEIIGITLTLFPSLQRIGCDAHVVCAGENTEIAHGDKPTYRIEFVRISDHDQAILKDHVEQLIRSLPNVSTRC